MQNYLIIGGSSGIGLKLVDLLKNSAHIYASFKNNEPESIEDVNFFQYDAVTDEELNVDLDELDGLVYCPGTINLKPFNRLKVSNFLDDLNINFIGAVKTIQQVLPNLKRSENASIVMLSTVAVQQGMPFHTSISASKGAIEGFTRSLAAELAPKIRVNAIAPSIVNTPLASRLLSNDEKIKAMGERHPLKRIGEPEDIAKTVAFLLSNENSWITGQILSVDGGLASIRST